MWAPARAIAWEIWGAHRRGFLTVLAIIPLSAISCQLFRGSLLRSDLLVDFGSLPMIISLIFVFAFFNYTEGDPSGRFASFPARLFVRPVPTSLLVTCPILYGVITVVGINLAWALLVFLPLGVEFPIGWTSSFLATAMVCYQSCIWSLAGFRLIRLLVMGAVGASLATIAFVYAVTSLIEDFFVLQDRFPGAAWAARAARANAETLLAIVLLTLILVAYITALLSVEQQRHGGGRGWRWWRKPLQIVANALPRRRKPFASPAGAQFWFEWRRNGVLLPFCVTVILVLAIGPILFFGGGYPDLTFQTFCWILILPVILAGIIGKGVARSDFWSLELTLSPFLATRPIASGDLVLAKMRVAAVSALSSWLVILAIAPLWLALWCDTSLLAEYWQSFQGHYAPAVLWIMLPLFFVAAVMLTWRLLVSGSWLALWGRPILFLGSLVLNLVTVVAVLIFIGWFLTHLEEWKAIRTLTPALKQIFEWIPWIAWCLNGLFILKVGLAAWSWSQSQRRGLLSARSLRRYLAFWMAGTCSLAVLPFLLDTTLKLETFPFDWIVHVEWLKYLFVLGALFILPWARPGLAPWTLAWNRHR